MLMSIVRLPNTSLQVLLLYCTLVVDNYTKVSTT